MFKRYTLMIFVLALIISIAVYFFMKPKKVYVAEPIYKSVCGMAYGSSDRGGCVMVLDEDLK